MDPIRALHLEDSPLDAELVRAVLEREGLPLSIELVNTRADFEAALAGEPFGLVLADFEVPGFAGLEALELTRDRWPTTPFLFVSGRIGEEVAIDSLKRGATDYVLKHRLDRLGPAVRRALKESAERTVARAAEIRLRESEERFRAVAEGLPQIVWVADPRGLREYSNRRWHDYTGLSIEASLGLGWLEHLHPEDRERTDAAWSDVNVDGRQFEIEHRFRDASGSYRWFLARALPLRDASGGIARWFGTCTDIELQRRSEEAERRRTAQLRRLASASARIHAARDVNSVVGVVTEEARELIGSGRAETIIPAGPDFPAGAHAVSEPHASTGLDGRADDRRGIVAPVPHPAAPIHLSADELRGVASEPDNLRERLATPPLAGWLAAPMKDRSGREVGLIQLAEKFEGEFDEDDEAILAQLAQMAAVALESARLYERLREDDRRKDEFLAMLAHELRNPLAAITSAAAVVGRSGGAEGLDWGLDVVNRQVGHLSRMIDDLLDVSRITRGKVELRPEGLDAGPIAAGAAVAVLPLIRERNHRLELKVGEALWTRADPVRLEQMITNLLTNAAKYTDHGGNITLEAAREGGEIVIRVRDDGLGIAPEALPRMFGLFTQGDRTLARSEGGLGIGLTLVKTLAEMHGGRVTAASDGPGRGSEFAVHLPAASYQAEAALPPRARAVAPAGLKVLLVDDNIDTLQSTAKLLQMEGYDVRTASDGPAALVAASSHNPIVVLLDIGLPGMDGYEVAAKIRADPPTRESVLIALTGYGRDEDRQRSAGSGFDRHLVKPVHPEVLLAAIAESVPAIARIPRAE